jgi:hypothetical protein
MPASDVDLGALYDERKPFALEALRGSLAALEALFAEAVALAGGLYAPRYALG